MPSRSYRIAAAVYARTGLSGIHVDALVALADSLGLNWPGQNGGLFGGRYPYMESRGDMRYLTPYSLTRLGI